MSINWYEKLKEGKYEEIISSIQNTELLNCSDYEYIVGTALLGQKRSKSALPFLKMAIEKDPLDAATKFNYAIACENTYLYVEAIQIYKDLIQGGVNSAGVYIALAKLLRNSGDYAASVDLLSTAPDQLGSKIEIIAELALNLGMNGNFESAEKILDKTDLNIVEKQKIFHIKSRLYKMSGDLGDSIVNSRNAIDLLITEKELADKKSLSNRAKKPMPVDIARKTLLRLTQLLNNNNFSYFLAYGTLLGIIRDGEILAHDKDLDLGLAWNTNRVKLIEVLENDGFFVKPGDKLSSNRSEWKITVFDKITGIGTDLFFFKETENAYLSGFYHLPTPLLWEFPIFEIETIPYAKYEVCIPKNPTLFLKSIYGNNWNVPDKYFDSVVSGCNITIECLDVARSYGYLRLYYSIKKNNFDKAFGYCKQLLAIEKNEWLFKISDWCLNKHQDQAKS